MEYSKKSKELVLKNRIKLARVERNLTQEQLAQLVGVSRQTIGSIEKGQFTPSAKLAIIIALVLDKMFSEVFYVESS